MKRNKIKYDRWLRMLLLSLALLTGGGWMAWGQVTDGSQRTEITLNHHFESGTDWHDNVFYETKIIYVHPGMNRELFIPELRNNIRGLSGTNEDQVDDRFNWFVHWYVVDKNGNAQSIDVIKHKKVSILRADAESQGGDWGGFASSYTTHETKDYFVKDKNGGLVWSKRIRDQIWRNGQEADRGSENGNGGYGMDASTIEFSLIENQIQQYDIYCDVSFYQDGSLSKNNGAITYTEPTLTKRYIFQLHDASEIKAVLEKNEDSSNIEPIKYDYPYEEDNLTINFSMPYMPDNYFWEVNGTTVQGKKFQYQYQGIDDENWYAFRLATRKNQRISLQQVQRIVNAKAYSPDKPITILVRVSDEEKETTYANVENPAIDSQNGNTKLVAKYIFTPQINSGFLLDNDELDAKKERWPRRDTERFEQIGNVDFDMGKVSETLEKDNNMSADPFGDFKNNWTSYGFLRMGANILRRNGSVWTSNQNVYGLFRSANKENLSKDTNVAYTDAEGYDVKYMWPATITAYTKLKNEYNRILYDRTAEISKEKNDGVPSEYGYFYYIDASNDAGKLVEVPVENICPNTELTVTAWVADMTRALYVDKDHKNKPLAPNINLLFKGVKHDKTEVVLHRFTSCDALTNYQEGAGTGDGGSDQLANINLMQWQQLCYKFVVNQNISDIESFHLEVQNNEPHTDGADYAIDDIRIFRTIPKVSLVQADEPCDLGTKFAKVKFVTDYDILLANMGLQRDGEIPNSNVDVDSYPEYENQTMALLKDYLDKHKEVSEEDYVKIMYMIYDPENPELPMRIKYNGKDKTYFRISYLATSPEKMEWTGNFEYNEDKYKSGEDIMISSTTISLEEGVLQGDKKYIARVFVRDVPLLEKYEQYLKEVEEKGSSTLLTENEINEVKSLYSLNSNLCALVGEFEIVLATEFLSIKSGDTSIDLPEKMEKGETYELTGNLSYLDDDDIASPPQLLENAVFDWFLGSKKEFEAADAIVVDGKKYSLQAALIEYHNDNTIKESIKQALNEKYGIAETTDRKATLVNGNCRIALEASSIEYKMENDFQNLTIYTPSQQGLGSNIRYCNEPISKGLGIAPPVIEPGDPDVPDPKDPDDPENPNNDPDPKDPDNNQSDDFDGKYVRSVRVGLVQIQDMQKNQGTLRIPIHYREETELTFYSDETNKNITVCKTSDNERTALIGQTVATLKSLVDEKKKGTPEWGQNYFQIEFNDLSVDPNKGFREGFWYMVEVPYKVAQNETTTDFYTGSFKLTLKIVPEYVTWVGSETGMHNWNNDGPNHWRRSINSELYMGDDNATTGAQVNGTHTEAYTPMRFTKVTIYGKAQDKANKYATDGDAYVAYPHLYELSKATGEYILDMAPTSMDGTIGAATKNIEYDLLADPDYEQELFGEGINFENPDKEQGHSYSCVRFYGNTCDEIYIKPESEILHTEYLTYNKAHVDYEMAPNRWYMLASPLKGVVSGDMYLPTGAGTGTSIVGSYARQETPAFDNITYLNNTDYTRWTPAVYMRGWNSSSVKVVYPEGQSVEYANSANWSNLYNDVDVPFTPGHGFSIGTKTSKFDDKVLFRLPKADTEHSYFSETGTSNGYKPITDNRKGNGRFYFSSDTTSLDVTTTGMFGNPFMSHLDMKEFIACNSENNTYYILSGSTMVANVINDTYRLSTESDYDPNYVAPLQSFIKNDLKDNKAVFTTDMIAKAPATPGKKVGLRSATAAASEKTLPQLRITASRGGVHNTALVAGLVTASDSYIEGEDAALLINEEVAAPQVYTLAGNQMTAINVTPELKDIPVGIYGKDASPVELSFKLSGDMQNVTLVDKQSGKVYPVTDGLTLTVSGNTSGRYFLNGSIATSNEVIARNEIVCYANGNGQIVVSSVDPLTRISVYSVSGQRLRYLDNLNMQTVYVKDLAPGIYIVKAESVTQVCSEKMEVK